MTEQKIRTWARGEPQLKTQDTQKAELANNHVSHWQQQKLHYLQLNINTRFYTTSLLPPVLAAWDLYVIMKYIRPQIWNNHPSTETLVYAK